MLIPVCHDQRRKLSPLKSGHTLSCGMLLIYLLLEEE